MYTSHCLVYVVILNSTCPHCNGLDAQFKAKGCVVQKLSQEHLTDGQITLLNKGALLILCSCIECGILNHLYENLSVSKDWLVVQLHQGDTGDNILQSNAKIKTVTLNDLDNDRTVNEVLHWLETESLNRTTTTTTTSSMDEQQQNTSVSTQEVLDQHTEILGQHTEILGHQTEVLEELRTGMGALRKLYSQRLI